MIGLLFLHCALGAYGTVEIVSVLDPAGSWRAVDRTGDAVRIRDGDESALQQGMELERGDEVRTGQARVEIRLEDNERISVGEGASLTLQERGALQRLGSVYYSLRGAFRVEYGHVEATVEGTRFLVDAEQTRLGVAGGAVRVRGGSDETLVERSEILQSPGGAVGTTSRWKRLDLGKALQNTWARGGPVAMVVGMAGVGLGRGVYEPGGSYARVAPYELVRVAGRVRPLPNLWAELSAAFALSGVRFARVPLALGGSYSLGPLAVGAELVALVDDGRVTVGLNPTGRFTWPLDRHLYVEAHGRLGWVGTVNTEVGAGLGWGF